MLLARFLPQRSISEALSWILTLYEFLIAFLGFVLPDLAPILIPVSGMQPGSFCRGATGWPVSGTTQCLIFLHLSAAIVILAATDAPVGGYVVFPLFRGSVNNSFSVLFRRDLAFHYLV